MYRQIFSEHEFDYIQNLSKDELKGSSMDPRKVYKIKYSVNLLP
jgi:hypothetical protein